MSETQTQATGVPLPKPTREEELLAQFPANSIVMFTRTEFAGQQGLILGAKSVGLGQTYLQARVTHFKNGQERPADRQKELLTLPTSVEHFTPPPPTVSTEADTGDDDVDDDEDDDEEEGV